MLRNRVVLLVALITSISSFGQDTTDYAPPVETRLKKDPRPLMDRLWFGGGLGLNFGSITAVQVEPMIGYKVDQGGKFSVGTGLNFWYISDNRYEPRVEYSAYGYRFFSRYRVIEQAYLHAELLELNVERSFLTFDGVGRVWVPHLLVGAGYREPIGDGGTSFTLQILWEVLQDPYSVYRGQGPIISGGIGVGF